MTLLAKTPPLADTDKACAGAFFSPPNNAETQTDPLANASSAANNRYFPCFSRTSVPDDSNFQTLLTFGLRSDVPNQRPSCALRVLKVARCRACGKFCFWQPDYRQEVLPKIFKKRLTFFGRTGRNLAKAMLLIAMLS